MYFFRIEVTSFDDVSKTLFVIPDQYADEQGVPFDVKFLTQNAEYKAFVKENETYMVDGVYTQFECENVLESITEDDFKQLMSEGKIKQLDSNSFSISTGFKAKKSGGKKDMKTYLIIGGAAVAIMFLLIVSAASKRGGNKKSECVTTPSSVSTDSVNYSSNSTLGR